jgi:cadmium resistance protein CadD (predicted permease)
VAFASTNIDDLFVLLGFFANPKLKARHVVAGQYLGIAALVAAALVGALLTLAVPDRYIGYLGVLPILIGVWHLWSAWHSTDDPGEVQTPTSCALGTGFATAAVTVANGSDNIAVYVPLFSRQPLSAILAICGVFAVMVAVWCLAAQWLVYHRTLGAPIRRWGGRAMPLVLIALGAYILISSGAIGSL